MIGGWMAQPLSTEVRILTISDTFEALASRRPYREDLTEEEVMDILNRSAGTGIDHECFEALKEFLEKGSGSRWNWRLRPMAGGGSGESLAIPPPFFCATFCKVWR